MLPNQQQKPLMIKPTLLPTNEQQTDGDTVRILDTDLPGPIGQVAAGRSTKPGLILAVTVVVTLGIAAAWMRGPSNLRTKLPLQPAAPTQPTLVTSPTTTVKTPQPVGKTARQDAATGAGAALITTEDVTTNKSVLVADNSGSDKFARETESGVKTVPETSLRLAETPMERVDATPASHSAYPVHQTTSVDTKHRTKPAKAPLKSSPVTTDSDLSLIAALVAQATNEPRVKSACQYNGTRDKITDSCSRQ